MTNEELPVIRRREANTHVRVKEGDAIVIGGLVETQERINDKRVPILSSIPLVGGLFTSKENSTIKKEVIIFITPRLMTEGEIVLSDRHQLIDEVGEIEDLRNVVTATDVRYKHNQKIHSESEEIQYLNETIDLLGFQEPPQGTSYKTDSVAVAYPDKMAQERKVLQEVIALLDVKNEQMSPAVAKQKKNYKYKASYGISGK